jgi:hypothetical protein
MRSPTADAHHWRVSREDSFATPQQAAAERWTVRQQQPPAPGQSALPTDTPSHTATPSHKIEKDLELPDGAEDDLEEAATQTRPPIFVEPDRLQVFEFSFSKEAITHRNKALAFRATSSAGMDVLPPESNSATRRTDSSVH